MPQTEAEIVAELAVLYARRQTTAGIRNNTFSDQSTTFDNEGLNDSISRLEQALATVRRGSSTRYAATSKGC